MKSTVQLFAGAFIVCCASTMAWTQETAQVNTEQPPVAETADGSVSSEANAIESVKPLAGYRNYEALTSALNELATSPLAELTSIGTTLEGREIWLLRVGDDGERRKPAILVVGNVEAAHVLGTEIALRMATQLIAQAESDESTKSFLVNYAVYFIPSPTPDATEKNFNLGQREHLGNSVATDDDRDFSDAEDPPVDLDGNGYVTMMRIEDSLGTHRVHPSDPRVMIKVDLTKNETATHRLIVESKDHDGDGQLGEDAGDGVDLNRNFTFNYDYFGKNAGVNQVSEIESRSLVDFCFDHPNIAVVLSFSNQDNLYHPWKPSSSGDSARIKSSILSADAPYANYLSDRFKGLHGGKNPPEAVTQSGSFVEWAYFHYGRWSFASRGWWIPEVKAKADGEADADSPPAPTENATAEDSPPENAKGDDAGTKKDKEKDNKEKDKEKDNKEKDNKEKEVVEKRGQADLNALRWLASKSIAGFADWTAVEHPDFKGKVVEVGGFLPFVRSQPPEGLIEEVVKPHLDFVTSLGDVLPKIEFRDAKVKSLGRDFFEIEVDLVNSAFLPTMSEMGRTNGEAYPIVVQFELPEQAQLIQGERKTLVRKLDGQGGKSSLKWLVRLEDVPDGTQLPLSAVAPTIPSTTVQIEIKR